MSYIDRETVMLKIQRHLMPNVGIDGTVTVEDAERYFLKLLNEQPSADVVEVSGLTPCDVCMYSPPSSGDGKPCAMCVARAKRGVEDVAPYEKGGTDGAR